MRVPLTYYIPIIQNICSVVKRKILPAADTKKRISCSLPLHTHKNVLKL